MKVTVEFDDGKKAKVVFHVKDVSVIANAKGTVRVSHSLGGVDVTSDSEPKSATAWWPNSFTRWESKEDGFDVYRLQEDDVSWELIASIEKV